MLIKKSTSKKLSIILTLVMLFSLLAPAFSFAADAKRVNVLKVTTKSMKQYDTQEITAIAYDKKATDTGVLYKFTYKAPGSTKVIGDTDFSEECTYEFTPDKYGTYQLTVYAVSNVDFEKYDGKKYVKSLKKSISVSKVTKKVSVTADDVSLVKGNTTEASVTADPDDATLSYKSSKTSVATVDSDGVITGKAIGEATITVTAKKSGYTTGTCTFKATVTDELTVTDITVDPDTVTVDNGTSEADAIAMLPAQVTLTLSNDETKDVDVTWDCATYDGTKAGVYTFTGTPELSDGVTNPDDLTATAKVTVKAPDVPADTVKPVITLKGDATVNLTVGDTWTDPGTTVTDNVDTDLVATVEGTVDTTKAGSYTLTYKATDKAGNVADPVTRTVVVVAPVTVSAITAIANISVANGTALTAAGLPATVEVTKSDSTKANVDVVWDGGTPAYSATTAGTYAFSGTLTMPVGITNPSSLKASVNVVVAAPVLAVSSVSAINSTATVPVATKVEAGSKLLVAFNQAIDATTVIDANFKLTSGTVTIATSRTISADKKSVTITPVTSLTISQAYKLTIANVKADGATTTLATASETTFTVADSMAVASLKSGVAGTTILDTFESTGSPLVIEFTKSYDSNTVNTSTIKLYNETTKTYAPLTAGIAFTTATTVTITPVAATYLINNKYTLTVNGVKALDGSDVAAYTKTYGYAASVSFAPTVTAIPRSAGSNTAMNGVYPGLATKVVYAATTPGAAATNAESVTASPFKAQVAFARAMDVTTLNDQNFKIVKVDVTGKEIAGTNVAGTVTFDSDSYIATFTPTAALAESTNYAAIITADVKDAFGVPATANTTLFTTGDFSAPTVASTSVDSGARVAVDADIVIHFSEPMNVAAAAFNYIAAGTEGLATATTNVDVWDATANIRFAAGVLNTAFINDLSDPRLIITAPGAGWTMNNIYRITINGYDAANPTFLCAADNRNGLLLQADKVLTFTTVEASRPTVTSVKTILTADGAAATTANTALSQTTMTYGVQNAGASPIGANNVFVVTFDQPMLIGAGTVNSAQNPASYQLWVDDGIGGGTVDDNIFDATEKYALAATITPVAGTLNKSFSIAPTGVSLAKLNAVEHNSRIVALFNVRAAANTADVAMGTATTANVAYMFTTGSGPAYANTSVPAKFATGVLTNIVDLRIDFSENVDWRTVNSNNIIVKDAAGNVVAGKFYSSATPAHAAVSTNLSSVFFAPNAVLTGNTVYTIQVTNGIKDAVGNVSAGYSYTFTTADTTVPVPTITMPSTTSGTDPIVVNFNTPMNGGAVVTVGNYALTVNGAPALFYVVANATNTSVSIYPDVPFITGDVVDVTVNAGTAAANTNVIAAQVSASQLKGTISPVAAYNIKTAVYNVTSKSLVLTLTRPLTTDPTVIGDFNFTNANVGALNFVGCVVSSDKMTVTVALMDSTVTPLVLVPGVSKINLAGAARYTDTTGSHAYSVTPVIIN